MTDYLLGLNSGRMMPSIGLGTWQGKPEETRRAVDHAVRSGYHLIDCAYAYKNEEAVGQALRDVMADGVVTRKDLWITTKLWTTFSDRVEECLDVSLKALGLDYVDLYLVHWPVAMNPKGNDPFMPTLENGDRDMVRDHNHLETWKQMEALLATGKVKDIGVCNYSLKNLKELVDAATVIPAVNQIELHPQLPQTSVVQFCEQHKIHVEAYSPLGSSGAPLTEEPLIKKIAEKHNTSPASVLLSYHVYYGRTVIAKSVTPERITANAKIPNLDDEDLKEIADYSAALERDGNVKRYIYPSFKVDLGFPDRKAPF